jgi:serine/threonine-protein kinase
MRDELGVGRVETRPPSILLPDQRMNMNELRPLDYVTCCKDIPEPSEPLGTAVGRELRAGYVLDGRFVIGGVVDNSGMATIYQAQDALDHHQLVAVKIPKMAYEVDPGFFSRFQREEDIGRKLNHPFLLKFIPVEGKKSRPYLVTEYLRGRTLFHLLQALRPFPEKDALKIASLLCEALQYLHDRGIVHRDLKPGNVMICSDRTIRIMDFGIASDASLRRITLPGFTSMIGTPDYMTPEQVKNERTDARTDIYCLGAILYEMLTGSVPFQNENTWVAMNDRVTGDPIAPRRLNPDLSPQAEEIVLHAMQRNPADRYASAAAMKAELDAPEKVHVTGYCHRLRPPKWRLSLRGTPVIAGLLLAIGFLSLQALLFLLLRHVLARH